MGKKLDKYEKLEKYNNNPNNVSMKDFISLITSFGFEKIRQRGSHIQYRVKNTSITLNIQSNANKAKPYQIKQLYKIINKG